MRVYGFADQSFDADDHSPGDPRRTSEEMKDLEHQTQWFPEWVSANMAYKKLQLSNHTPPQIRKFIFSVEDLSFSISPSGPASRTSARIPSS